MKTRKITATLLTVSMIGAILSGCGSNTGSNSQTTASSADDAATYNIGITQYAEHGSLDNCRDGFVAGLASEGIVEGVNLTITFQNAQADSGTTAQIADQFASANMDLICAIATPSAQSCYNAAMDKDIPVIYTAVTDPVAAQLANEDGTPVGNITGTSDKLPVEAQLDLIRKLLPDAKTIGIMYTTSEVNSETTIAEYEEKAGDYGFTIVKQGISTSADIALATDSLLSQVDCLNNLTDNTVVQGLPTILAKAAEKNIPVFGSEIEQVKIGCLASAGLDYVALGEKTGQMAAQVLKGEAKASDMPFETFDDYSTYFNQKVADDLGITVDSAALEGAEIFTEITE